MCRSCGETKLISEFYKDKSTNDGKTYKCKECSKRAAKSYHDEHLEQERSSTRSWKRNNPEKVQQQRKRESYRKANTPERIERRRIAEIKRKEANAKKVFRSINHKIRMVHAEYKRKNPEVRREKWRARYSNFYQNNRDKEVKRQAIYKAKRFAAPAGFTHLVKGELLEVCLLRHELNKYTRNGRKRNEE